MGKLYEQQEDGTLKPLNKPDHLVRRLDIYEWLKGRNLSLEEIEFIMIHYRRLQSIDK